MSFYAAMTRARRFLALCQTTPHQFVKESGVDAVTKVVVAVELPEADRVPGLW